MLNQLCRSARQILASTILLTPLAVQAVDIQISQLLDVPDPAIRAGELTYTTKILNGANDTANNVVLTIPLPATTSFVSVDNGSCSHDSGSPGTVTCNLGNITGDGLGAPVTTINTTIRTSAATGNTISVTATGSTSSIDTDPSNDSETQNTTIDDGADLVTTITDVADPVTAGGNVAYTVTINNQGPNDAATATVTNTLPADVTYVSASGSGWSCSNSGQTVTCTRASGITNAATAPAITITGKVTGAVTGTITDSVTVSSTTGDPDPNNNTTTEDTLINSGTDLSMSKSVSPNPVIGGTATTFTLSPRNLGPFDATTAVVTDILPAGFTFNSVNVTGSGSWSCSETTGTVTCNLANFAVGNTDNIVITTTAPASGTFSNTATVSSATTDPDPGNDSGSVTNVNIVPDGADLSIAKSKSPDPVAQGSPIASSIVVTNNGPQATSGTLTVTDVLNGETYVSASGTNWSCTPSGSAPNETVTCTYSATPLAASASTPSLSITTTATNTGTLTNNATVSDSGGTTDGVPGNNSTSASVVSTGQIADLSLTKSADAAGDSTLTVGENTITYTLTLTNNGPDNLTDPSNGSIDNAIVISDAIPRYTTGIVGATPSATAVAVTSANPNFTCTTGSTVTCRLNDGATFANSAVETFTITATRPFADGAVHSNSASVSSAVLGDDVPGNNTSNTTTINVDPIADIEMTSKVITPDPVQAGTNATYVLSFRNNGPSTAANVTLQDVFSPPVGRNYTVLSVTPTKGTCDPFGSNAANTLDCNIGSLSRNEAETVTMVIRPEWDLGNNTWNMSNTATVSTTTDQGANASPDSKTATLNVGQADVDLLVNKTDLSDPVGYTPTPGAFPGSLDNIIVYQVDMTNRGPSLATSVSLQDVMTPKTGKQLTFLCDDAGSASCAVGTSTCNNTNTAVTGPASLTLTCPQANMNPNTTLTRYLFFRVDSAPAATGDTHNNVATISSNEDDSIPANDSEGEDTSVRARVDVGVTKAPSVGMVNINQPFNWNLVVFNNGPGDSDQTSLSDTLPTGMVLTGAPIPGSGSCTGVANSTSFTCHLGTVNRRAVSGVADGNDVAITVPVRVTTYPGGGTITNTASVTTFGVDSNSSNNSDSGTVNVQKSSLAGFVYEDNNDDGNKTGGENGISGVTLTLTGTDLYGNAVNTPATTSGTGAFLFDDLPPADGSGYTITETHPVAYVDGQENAAGSIIPNSNTTDVISAIAVPPNTAVTGYLFGELGASSTTGILSGYVYNDGSDDGDRTGNPGIENVTITLTGTDTNGAVNKNTTTAANGSYSFPNLLPGTYTLTQTQPAGYDDHIDTVGQIGGSDVGTLGNDVISNITLLAGDVGTEYNFADSNTAITGFVYVDTNNDGIKDTGETGIQGVTLTLTGNDSNGNPVNQTTTTDANGAYSFTGMLASDSNGYTVTETHPTAWADGKDTVGNAGGSTASNDVISGIIITSSTRAIDYNFGELGAALSGVVYNDNGDDGQKENSDPGIGGVTITLTGTDLNGNPVSLVAVTGDDGAYRFDNLPMPNGSGYTITETQPPGVNDGKENTSNVITGVTITTPGVEETGFNFGEIIPPAQAASVSGRVHDRDDLNTTHSQWIVEIVRNGLVVATAITESSGYRFDGLTPGAGYEIRFRHPESNAVFGVLENLTLTANTELPNQNLPLDPSGVVYDSVTRQPVPGAIVTLSGPPGFNPAVDLIGGTGNVNQTVGSDGLYKYLLNPSAPAGVYSLTVLQPTGYLPPNSVNIPDPCTGTLTVGAIPAPAEIQPQETAPDASAPLHNPGSCPALGASGTQYYLSFNLSATSADVINNHIPLDPSGSISGLTVVKSTPKANVTRGELVPYSIRVTNNLATPITNIRIRDQIPPGFKYVANSAILDGSRNEPVINNRELTWPAQDYAVGQTHEVKLILVIGAGVGEGEYINQAWGVNGPSGVTATSVAEATVRIVPDPTFDCSDLIGKVFDDKNTNGYQDEGEAGLPGIRVVTARGLVITTDANGRYHVPCAAVPNELRGSNFILKLDEQTLPSGYRITTENPRVVRMTRGKLAKLNFGAAIHRVVRLDLNAKAFDQDSDELRSDYEEHMQKLLDVLSKEPSVLRVAYAANGEEKNQIKQRLANFRKYLESIWGDCDCNHELIIEQEVLWEPTATRGSVSTGRAK